MATLTAWKFDSADGADAAVGTLQSLEKQELITIHDAATVSWQPDARKPRTEQLHGTVGTGRWAGCSGACRSD